MRSTGLLDFYRGEDGLRFLAQQGALLVAAALVLLALFGSSDLDRIIAHRFFDAALGAFPRTNDWWLKTVLHDGARTAAAVAFLAVLAITALSWLEAPWTFLRKAKHGLALVVTAALAATIAVAACKHMSGHACPWDIVDFGGFARYRHLLAPHGALPPVDGCFPAAHPLVGYGWLGAAFALYPSSRRLAAAATLAALLIGTALGFVQVMRGAHFVSHVLWTAWAVWAVNLALLSLWRSLATRTATAPRGLHIGAAG
jgi:membrane-associated PAP2 superfamily phosphatase